MNYYKISSSTAIEDNDILIMHENDPVIAFNMDEGKYLILDYEHLPFTMKNNLQKLSYDISTLTVKEIQELLERKDKNRKIILSWLANRSLSVPYQNASQILDNIYFGHMDSKYERARLSIKHNAVSVLDNYWVKQADEKTLWSNINIRNKRVTDKIVQIELYKCPDASSSKFVKDMLDAGTYNKIWERNGDIFSLYKLGKDDSKQPAIEAMVSRVLECTSAKICKYELSEFDGYIASKCDILTDEDNSIIIGKDFIEYCKNHNLNHIEQLARIDRDGLYNMWIVDYLIANPYRGDYDWGVIYNPKTMKMIKIHPILDFNEAFDNKAMNDPNAIYKFNNKSLRDSAKSALRLCNFSISSNLKQDIFMNSRQYICFSTRASDLGLLQI